MENKVTIGSLIEAEVRKQQMSITEFAQKICNERQNAYKIFKKNDISLEQLRMISKALNHNFFEDLSKDPDLAMPVEISDEEINRLQALDQFLDFVPKAFGKLGYEVTLLKTYSHKLDPSIPIPDYFATDFNITFTEGMTFKEKWNNFHPSKYMFYNVPNNKQMIGYMDQYSGIQHLDIAIVLKDDVEWLNTIKAALDEIDTFYLPKTWFELSKLHKI